MHHHPTRALHQRLDNKRGDAVVVLGEIAVQRRSGPRGNIGCGFPRLSGPRVRRRHGGRLAQQRRVSVLVKRNITHAQRTQRLAVIAAGHADELILFRLAVITPVVE